MTAQFMAAQEKPQTAIGLHVCPNCCYVLFPVALLEDAWGCRNCKETWHLPEEESK